MRLALLPAVALAATEWLHATERTAFVASDVCTPAECAHIAELASGSLQEAYVGGASSDSRLDRRVRDARATILFQTRWKDPVLLNVSSRVRLAAAALAHQSAFPGLLLSDWHLEFPQVVRYDQGGHYVWHQDGVPTSCGLFDWIGCRVFTAVLYLNSLPADAGGATALRFADGSETRVQPREGSALFFLSTMLHTGEEVRGAGQHKLIVNQWIRFRPLPAVVYYGGGFLGVLESLTGGSVMELFAAAERCARSLSSQSVLAVVVALLASACLLAFALVLATARCTRRVALSYSKGLLRPWLLRSTGTARPKILPKTV